MQQLLANHYDGVKVYFKGDRAEQLETLLSDLKLFGEIVYGNERTWQFEYSTINEAPFDHFAAVALSVSYSCPEVAAKLGYKTPGYVERILAHPPMARVRDLIDLYRRTKDIEIRQDFEEGLSSSVKELKNRIKSGALDDRALVNATKLFMEFDPGKTFSKNQSQKGDGQGIDDSNLKRIANAALELRLEREMERAAAATKEQENRNAISVAATTDEGDHDLEGVSDVAEEQVGELESRRAKNADAALRGGH